MKKIIKYIIIFTCLFSLININNVNAKNNDIVLINEDNKNDADDTGNYNPNTLVAVEIFCGIIGVIMLYIAAKTRDN